VVTIDGLSQLNGLFIVHMLGKEITFLLESWNGAILAGTTAALCRYHRVDIRYRIVEGFCVETKHMMELKLLLLLVLLIVQVDGGVQSLLDTSRLSTILSEIEKLEGMREPKCHTTSYR